MPSKFINDGNERLNKTADKIVQSKAQRWNILFKFKPASILPEFLISFTGEDRDLFFILDHK